MANHPSAEKRNRQRVKRTIRNRAVKSSVRTLVKRVHTALEAKDTKAAATALASAIVALDKASSKGVLHPKAASRTVSRLSAQVHALSPLSPKAAASPKAPPSPKAPKAPKK